MDASIEGGLMMENNWEVLERVAREYMKLESQKEIEAFVHSFIYTWLIW